jgi:hypothetical protein
VIKVSLKSFCKDPALLELLQKHVHTLDRITTETYHLINLLLRHRYEQDPDNFTEQKWTRDRVLLYMCAVSKPEPKPDANVAAMLDSDVDTATSVREFCRQHYMPLRGNLEPPDRTGLPGNALQEVATRIAASIETNIREHFFRRQLHNIFWRECIPNQASGTKLAPEERKQAWKKARERQTEINEKAVTERLADKSLPRPDTIEKSVAYHLEAHAEAFVGLLLWMNSQLEEKGQKKFAVLPMSTGFVPGANLHIDTDSLERLVGWQPQAQAYKAAKKERLAKQPKRPPPGRNTSELALNEKDLLWQAFFEVERVAPESRVARGVLRFGHHITTDGVSVSCTVLHPRPTRIEDKGGNGGGKTTKKRRGVGRAGRKRAAYEAGADAQSELLRRVQADGVPETKLVGADPGLHNLLFLSNGDKHLSYTAGQRRHESMAALRAKRHEKEGHVQELENRLSLQDHRAVKLEKFKSYLKARFEVQEALYEHYAHGLGFRLDRMYNWRDRRSSEDCLVQRVIDAYGEDAVIGYGSWSAKRCMRGLPPAPTVGLRHRFERRMRVITVPERNTTKTCSNCSKQVEPDKSRSTVYRDGTIKPARGIRRCNSEECGGLLRWNRDLNAALNIRANLSHAVRTGQWDPRFGPNPEHELPRFPMASASAQRTRRRK